MTHVLRRWLPAAPFVVAVGVLLGGAAVWLVVTSFQTQDGTWVTDAWTSAFDDPRTVDALWNTLQVSALTATIAVLVGTPLVLAISASSHVGRPLGVALANAAANFGGATLAVAWISTLGTFGFVRLSAQELGGFDVPVDLASVSGYVVMFCSFVVPLYVLLTLPAVGALRPELWEAVQCSGGSRLRYWRKVALPVLAPFVASGWVLCFAWSAGQFSAPFALVGNTPAEPLVTLRIGELLFSAIGGSLRYQQAAVYSLLLVAMAVAALVAYQRSTRRVLRWIEGV